MKQTTSKISLASSMLVFGTIGIFVRYIDMPSGIVAFIRGALGALFLLAAAVLKKKLPERNAIRKNIFLLIFSGMCIGVNWIFLFESYKFTTVAAATLCYYLAPVFVLIASPIVLREKLTLKKLLCVIVALIGMVFVSGVTAGGFAGIKGILLAIGAAVFYATVIICNKKMKDITPSDMTTIQLAVAALTVLPYSLIAENLAEIKFTPVAVTMLIVVGIIHTGVAYVLYFGSVNKLSSGTIAIFSYIDPIFAVILSAVLLREPLTFQTIIGAVLILGATLASELNFRKCKS